MATADRTAAPAVHMTRFSIFSAEAEFAGVGANKTGESLIKSLIIGGLKMRLQPTRLGIPKRRTRVPKICLFANQNARPEAAAPVVASLELRVPRVRNNLFRSFPAFDLSG